MSPLDRFTICQTIGEWQLFAPSGQSYSRAAKRDFPGMVRTRRPLAFLLLIGSTHQRPVCEKTKRSGQPSQGEARIRKRMSYSELWPRRMMVTVVTSR
jgi:hypothetical protein